MIKETCFNAHHSPVGAFSTFTLGYTGASGGLGIELSGPANQNVFIGVESSEKKNLFETLPFYGNVANDRERFEQVKLEETELTGAALKPFATDRIRRDFSLSMDTWRAGDLTFNIISPVKSVPDPQKCSEEKLRDALLPAVFVELSVDNTKGNKPRNAFFGFQGTDPYSAMRRIDNTTGGKLIGIGQGRHIAICTDDPSVKSGLAFSIEDLATPDNKYLTNFGLGTVGALVMTAQPGKISTRRFVVCFYRGGVVTSGIDATYYYTRLFDSIENAAFYAIKNFNHNKSLAIESNKSLDDAALNDERKFMIAHAVRSYYGSSQLLYAENKPLWVVNEGEYRMINTFDLTVDHLFFEMKMNPWTVRNVLDMYVNRYSYRDKVKLPGHKEKFPGGLSFTHDMGVGNVFSSPGTSAYELPGFTGCFSHMTHEQLVNWILCAGVYALKSNDTEWMLSKLDVFTDCFKSMESRDHYDYSTLDGIMDLDSSRTMDGCEITTYDNVDTALGQARRNTYLAVKCWAAYLILERIFKAGSLDALQESALSRAARCAESILSGRRPDGSIAAILESDNESATISIIEGLAFLWFIDHNVLKSNGPHVKLVDALKTHFGVVMKKGKCLFDDGGWKLSSTSDNSWLSKIYLCQFISEKILGIKNDERADKAHLQWLLDPQNSYFAWSDQMKKGKVCGSRYYPRGVTSILWIVESR